MKTILGWVLLVAAGAILAKLLLQAQRHEAPITEMMDPALVRPVPTLLIGARRRAHRRHDSVGSGR